MDLVITIKMENDKLMGVNVEKAKADTEVVCSRYAKFFDESSPYWCKDADRNRLFLAQIKAFMNTRLKREGHLFLNEVLYELGMSRTKEGQLVGWIFDEDNPIGDNFVDIQVIPKAGHDRVKYDEPILLDFNVDGYILDRLG